MVIQQIDTAQVAEHVLADLDIVDEGFLLFDVEVLAALLRRAASVLCPASPREVRTAVRASLSGLVEPSVLEATLPEILEGLVQIGDLIEMRSDTPGQIALLYLNRPAFVVRGRNLVLLGCRANTTALADWGDHGPPQATGLLRRHPLRDDLVQHLLDQGLVQHRDDQWLRSPREIAAPELLADARRRLDANPTPPLSGPIRVLDPTTKVTYYAGRWRDPGPSDTGIRVIRRPQQYGADLWAVAQMTNGIVESLVDLPAWDPAARGCDEAWRLQAAVDATNGRPQLLRIGDDNEGVRLTVFSPLPSWAVRRLEVVGQRDAEHRGGLAAFVLSRDDADTEAGHLRSRLWMMQEET